MKIKITALILVLFLSSCATLFSSGRQNVSFDSNEKDVEVYINGQKMCDTPCIAKVERSRDTLLIVGKKEGFDDSVVTVNSVVNVVTLVNLISLSVGSFGISTDVSSSNAWEYQPNAFYFTMEKADNSVAGKSRRAEENKIRSYVLSNYADIKADVVYNGKKEYLLALSQMTKLSVDRLTALVSESSNEAEFANSIIKEYRKKH